MTDTSANAPTLHIHTTLLTRATVLPMVGVALVVAFWANFYIQTGRAAEMEGAEALAETKVGIGMVGAMGKDGIDIGTIATIIMAMEVAAGAGETSMSDTSPLRGFEMVLKHQVSVGRTEFGMGNVRGLYVEECGSTRS